MKADEAAEFMDKDRETDRFKRVYGVESIVWGAYFLARSGVRLAALLAGSLENFLVVVVVTGPPMMLLLMVWSIRYAIRELDDGAHGTSA